MGSGQMNALGGIRTRDEPLLCRLETTDPCDLFWMQSVKNNWYYDTN